MSKGKVKFVTENVFLKILKKRIINISQLETQILVVSPWEDIWFYNLLLFRVLKGKYDLIFIRLKITEELFLKFSKVAFELIENGENAKQRAIIFRKLWTTGKGLLWQPFQLCVNCSYSQ